LIATLAGGILLACVALCAGVATFLAVAPVAREEAMAMETAPVQQGKEELRPRRPLPVGFRKTAFTYTSRGDK
jgi:hypothetical protein